MAHLDHNAAYADFRDRVLDGIRAHFPDGKIEGKEKTLHLEGLEVVEGDLHSDDIRAQHKAKVSGQTWAAPVMAKLTLKDNSTGKTVHSQKIRIAEIPRVTRRHSYILDGQEYQVDNQWQLKPGVYTRRKQTGELEAQFNVPNQQPTRINFDPASKLFTMERGKSNIPIYPLMKVMGVDDDTLEKEWGKETLKANKEARGVATAVEKFYRADRRNAPKTKEEAERYFYETMQAAELRPDSTALTLGKPMKSIDGETFRRATARILGVHAGAPEDDRDSLEFKDLRTSGDFAFDKLTNWKTAKSIRDKAARKINSAGSVRDVVKFDTFNEPIKQTFHKNSLSNVPDQTNPVEMLGASQQTTIMGPGGIKTENQIVEEAKFINPSHLGFLDPIKTPEGSKTGVTLRLPMGVKKVGREPRIPLYNMRTGKTELVGPVQFAKSKVLLPDQVDWTKDGKAKPISSSVKMSVEGNKVEEGNPREALYAMRHPSQLFSVASNLIPFLGNTSGNRASYASNHIEQAVSLLDRDAPLVQSATGSNKEGIRTFEELLGRQSGHTSPISGRVVEIKDDAVVIRGKDGKNREVQIYRNFPLNDAKSVLHSTPTVKVGDSVKAGQPVADTNFTKKGKLALGTNLRVSYFPFKGYNFEDGVVISESAAKKLTSVHMHKPSIKLDEKTVQSPKKFQVQHPEAFTKDQYGKLDGNGVVRKGQKVMPGDPLVVAMKPFQLKDRMGLGAIRRSLSGQHTDTSLRWTSDYPGEVVSINKNKKGEVTVHVRTLEPMQVGDKLAGRYGNKGIVTLVLPDKEMPATKNGKHIEVALNPSGVPGRMNTGQVLETAAAKIAEKTGKPYVVSNFDRADVLEKVKSDLKKYGLEDTEELFDPVTGVALGKALTGPQHIIKLRHQIDKKLAARAGMGLPGSDIEPEKYDFNLMPAGGGKAAGQRMGHLGFNVLLAHGARANIREMQTWKSEGPDPQTNETKRHPSQHTDVWNAIQTGAPLPIPRPTFAFQKFTDMLRAAGINIEKKGHQFQLGPLTDKQILSMSSGALPKPGHLTYPRADKDGDPKPVPGGLFDTKLTGGHGGKKWSHMQLAEPMPNPVYEGAIQKVLGLSSKEYTSLISSEKAINKRGEFVSVDSPGSMSGGAAIQQMLKKIDVTKDLAAAEKELSSTTIPKGFAHGAATPKIDKLLKRVKYLRALKKAGVSADEAYVLKNLPVLPPAMRPVSVLPDGNIKWADINGLYQSFAQVNGQLQDPKIAKNLTDSGKARLRADMYDGLKALMGTITVKKEDSKKGLLQQIHGAQPKDGYFQRTMMNRRQDLTMRSVIAPEPALGIDEVGLPEEKAATLYRPFVARKLVDMGAAPHALEAQRMIKEKDPSARRALELVTQERPVMIKRDPALHKHNVQAFRPRLVPGRAIQIHPLVTGGFNADFDGDTMSAYVPISREAVEEAHKMFPSNNLFNEATGHVAFQPSLESALGLYKMSLIGNKKAKPFKSPAEALKAVQAGKIEITDPVTVGRKKTTPGRILLSRAVPDSMKEEMLSGTSPIDKKGLSKLYGSLAKDHAGDFGEAADKLKDLGNGMAFGAIPVLHPNHKGQNLLYAKEKPKERVQFIPTKTHTLSLDDFTPDKQTRDKYLNEAQKKVDALGKRKLSKDELYQRSIDIWSEAAKKMEDEHRSKMGRHPNNLAMMNFAGVKPSFDQYKQMVLAPVLVSDAAGNLVETPIKRSYSEGLDTAGYWTQMSGARRGSVLKVQEVQDPGYLSKQLVNTTMNLVVNGDDCGTARGVAMSIGSSDIHDRQLARDFKAKNVVFKAGTTLTPDVVGKMRAADKNAQIVVRTPLKCEHAKGLCQKCAGIGPNGKPYEKGTNLGVLSAQALGERSMQLTMKAFHSGGVQSSGGNKLINQFGRIEQLTRLPKDIPDASTLAMRSGTIEKVERDKTGVKVWIGGVAHHVGKDRSGTPLYEENAHARKAEGYIPWVPPKKGMKVEAGQQLSDPNRTVVNPHHLYKATGNMERVQNFLVDELHKIYGEEGVRKLPTEVVVKAMSNLTKVRDPGDADGILRGEFQQHSQVRALNANLMKKGRRPVQHSPILQGVDMLPLSVQEDWMAKMMHNRIRQTLQESAATGATSEIHGLHPIPGAAYGAEFGLTSRHALKPGFGKLKDVPEYAY